jgi:maleylacetate reductase
MKTMDEFRYIGYAQEIIFGPGSLARIGEAVERFGWQRLMLCTSASQRRNGAIATVEGALGERLLATYDAVQSHVQASQVTAVLELAEQHNADAIIGLGGGSPLGLAKAVSFALEEKHGELHHTSPIAQPLVPVIAIPTTYAGSEMTPVYGVTRLLDGQPRKITISDAKIAPKLVIYDPQLTLDLPPALTASTGINALAHSIEALYSITRNPLSTASALRSIRLIMQTLPLCFAHGHDLAARIAMLEGAMLAGNALAHVTMALHHGLCHVLGGTAGIPHGIANSIILPHALLFNLDATAPQLALAADAMGIPLANRSAEAAAADAIQSISNLIEQMKLPQRLRDFGVRESDLPHLAQLAFQNRTVQSNPKPITNAEDIEGILRAAW